MRYPSWNPTPNGWQMQIYFFTCCQPPWAQPWSHNNVVWYCARDELLRLTNAQCSPPPQCLDEWLSKLHSSNVMNAQHKSVIATGHMLRQASPACVKLFAMCLKPQPCIQVAYFQHSRRDTPAQAGSNAENYCEIQNVMFRNDSTSLSTMG